MKITLSELARALGGTLHGEDVVVSSVTASSSDVRAGSLFVALRGVKTDGHAFVGDTFARGGAAAVVERAESLREYPGIIVSDTHRALSTLASMFADSPARAMKIVALTGTNGKTTINWLVYRALLALKQPAVRIGTLGIEAIDRSGRKILDLPGVLTTPDPVSLHRYLQTCVSGGVDACVIETSSHALDQKRVEDIFPDVAVFTNLTRDHLDYHETMENYFHAKMRLFDLLANSPKATRAAVINFDDEYGRMLVNQFKKSCTDFSYGVSVGAAVRIVSFDRLPEARSTLTVRYGGADTKISTPLIGGYNGVNLTAAFASCVALGFSPADVAEVLKDVDAAPGRLERIAAKTISVYVDYAHTPDALERALMAVRAYSSGKVWVVFGCGGDRDRGKRPEMGEIAANTADSVIVTSDNPRSEDPMAIIDEIMQACPAATREVDRRIAIQAAVANAQNGDTVLIAGKGHEDYQIIGETRSHFSDSEVARLAIAARESV